MTFSSPLIANTIILSATLFGSILIFFLLRNYLPQLRLNRYKYVISKTLLIGVLLLLYALQPWILDRQTNYIIYPNLQTLTFIGFIGTMFIISSFAMRSRQIWGLYLLYVITFLGGASVLFLVYFTKGDIFQKIATAIGGLILWIPSIIFLHFTQEVLEEANFFKKRKTTP